jgi:hypothetical protein
LTILIRLPALATVRGNPTPTEFIRPNPSAPPVKVIPKRNRLVRVICVIGIRTELFCIDKRLFVSRFMGFNNVIVSNPFI